MAESASPKPRGPWFLGDHVRQLLQHLQVTWDKDGPFDANRMRELIAEFRTKEIDGTADEPRFIPRTL
jgi:hypothetical protein